jgi:hypothetical protein
VCGRGAGAQQRFAPRVSLSIYLSIYQGQGESDALAALLQARADLNAAYD